MAPQPDPTQAVSGVAKLLSQLQLRAVPLKPEAGKWRNIGPALDWLVRLCGAGPRMKALGEDALRRMSLQAVSASGEITADMPVNEVHGGPLQSIRELIIPNGQNLLARLMLLCSSASRYVTCLFLKASEYLHDACRPCVIILGPSSPTKAVDPKAS